MYMSIYIYTFGPKCLWSGLNKLRLLFGWSFATVMRMSLVGARKGVGEVTFAPDLTRATH